MTWLEDAISKLQSLGYSATDASNIAKQLSELDPREKWRQEVMEYVLVGGICLVALVIGAFVVRYFWVRTEPVKPQPVYVPNVQTPIGSTHELIEMTKAIPTTPANVGLITNVPPAPASPPVSPPLQA